MPLKVCFLGFPLTPYFRDFYNHLQRRDELEIVHIRPRGKHRHIGAGVHEDFTNLHFDACELPEVVRDPVRMFGLYDLEVSPAYADFEGLASFLAEKAPHIIVVDTPYHSAFSYTRELRRVVRRNRIKVVFRSIPFALLPYREALAEVPIPDRIRLNSSPILARIARLTTADRLYGQLIRVRTLQREVKRCRGIFNQCDAHVIYHEGGRDVYGSYGVSQSKLFVVRNSPDTDRLMEAERRVTREAAPIRENTQRIIHVGRLVEWKRVDLLIDALGILQEGSHSGCKLTIIGKGPCEASLRAMVKKRGLDAFVTFVGAIYEPEALARHFLSSSVYVLAGMGGLSINEAMCFGLPVICSRCDGTEKFLVRDGYNGLYFREGDCSDLARQIDKLLTDDELRSLMGRRSKKIIEEEINIRILVNNYLWVFDALGKR